MLQLPLDFELKVDATFDNFMEGQNALLIQALKGLSSGQSEFLYFYGDSGSGKTHLLQALAHSMSDQQNYNLAYIPLDSDALSPQLLASFEAFDGVCLDAFDSILSRENSREWQEALFHFYNQLRDQGKSLIIAASEAPSGLAISLADLKSRLGAMFIHEIKPLSDEDKLIYIKRKAQEKGLSLTDDLANYLLSRGKRDLASLNQALDKLDAASLQAQRKVTKPFIKEVLDL